MEGLVVSAHAWNGRRVLLTGASGFKGSWLSLWLERLGAVVHGLALAPPTSPSLFDLGRIGEGISFREGDVRAPEAVDRALEEARPEVVFHLAAQPLVRASYDTPVETFHTNVLGTVNVLDAVRRAPGRVRAVVVITSDKCYENREWHWPYREDDALGGRDPYSASKGCAEIVTSSYARSFLVSQGIGVATARAGNVIGGGDWARDRIVPDAVAALSRGEAIAVRSPNSVRPWQHVLEPLDGYLRLAERLLEAPTAYSEAWNFGPSNEAIRPVSELASAVCASWGDDARWLAVGAPSVHEATLLTLDASKARARLGWSGRLGFAATIEWTVAWYKAWRRGVDLREFTFEQIRRFEEIRT